MDIRQDPSFGARLRRLREAAGLSQEELASRAGLTANAIGALERGERRHPYPHTVRALADALELSEDERASLLASVPRRGATASTVALAPAPPTTATSFIGREEDVASVRSLFEGGDARLLTLTGPGGVGKTRLASEVANRMGDRVPDGVAFVALAPVGDPALLLSTVAQALGLREVGDRSARELVHGYLRDKRLLLVLDNLEHLLEAAPEVAELLAACPPLKVLATSRAPLRVRGEREYRVAPLAVPDPTRPPDAEGVTEAPAARLFVERALEANPSFKLTRNNAAAVAAICWRLEGLPLALELAAAKVRFLGATELLSRLDQALEIAGARDLPERQKTMRATLDWSHDLLSGPERALFRRLSVFAGGFFLEAAEVVGADGEEAGAEDVLELLGSLVEQSLVTAGTDGGEDTLRYGMLEPVRQYALERLQESGEEEQVRARHATFFLALAKRAGPQLMGADQAAWLERLAREHDNLRAALQRLLEQGEAESVARIGWEIRLFWSLRGHTGEGRRWMELALSHSLAEGARARALWVVAVLSFVRGEADRAAGTLDESIAAARAADDAEALAAALMLRGLAALSVGDPVLAEQILARALELFRERDDRWGVSIGLSGLAQVAMARGDFDRAEGMLAEDEALSRAAGDWFTLTANLNTQALMALLRGDEERAEARLRESVEHAGTLRDAFTVVLDAAGLAGLAARRGQPERAARLFGAAAALREQMGVSVAWSSWRALHERDLALAREQLDAQTFDEEWARGGAMTLEQVVDEALAQNT